MIKKKLLLLIVNKLRKKTGVNPIVLLLSPLMILLMIPIIIFNPGSCDYEDAYEAAWSDLECSDASSYVLQDVRGFESYVDPTSYNSITKETAMVRLIATYIDVSYDANQVKNCFMKPDKKIINKLKKDYAFTAIQVEEMLNNIYAIRNGRQNLILPIEEAIQVGSYDKREDRLGILLKASNQSDVVALSDGEITNIETSATTLPYSPAIKQGLSVTITYGVQKGINSKGEYDVETMYATYGAMSDVTLNVGTKVLQGEIIGRTKDDLLYLSLMDEDKQTVDPEYYFQTVKQVASLQLPFDLPYTVTSELGERTLVPGKPDFHYGIDLVKEIDAPIRALANGEVVLANTTCSPYGGSLGSTCPQLNPLPGAGNYAMIKYEFEDKTYYATYMHMSTVNVAQGDLVSAGDVIGYQGHSGNSTAAHLHLEIHEGITGVSTKEGLIDPREMLDFGD